MGSLCSSFLSSVPMSDSNSLDAQHELLGGHVALANEHQSFRIAPLLTGDVYNALGQGSFPQCSLYGRVVAQHASNFPAKPACSKLWVNTNTPFSALICGVQVRMS